MRATCPLRAAIGSRQKERVAALLPMPRTMTTGSFRCVRLVGHSSSRQRWQSHDTGRLMVFYSVVPDRRSALTQRPCGAMSAPQGSGGGGNDGGTKTDTGTDQPWGQSVVKSPSWQPSTTNRIFPEPRSVVLRAQYHPVDCLRQIGPRQTSSCPMFTPSLS